MQQRPQAARCEAQGGCRFCTHVLGRLSSTWQTIARTSGHCDLLEVRADGVLFAPLQLEQLYSSVAWPLYKLYGHAFDAFKVMVQDPDAVFSKLLEVGGQEKGC